MQFRVGTNCEASSCHYNCACMSAKALIEVDVRIAVLRAETAQGKGNADGAAQLEELLKQRGELIVKLVAERNGETPQHP